MRAVAGVPAHQLVQTDREIGAGHAIAAVLEDDVVSRDFELLGGERQALADHLSARRSTARRRG